MPVSRDQIEHALHRVQAGELSPAEAAQALLHAEVGTVETESASPFHDESLPRLIDRLGIPPSDVIDSWCCQLLNLAAKQESESNRPMPTVLPDQLTIDRDGRLCYLGQPCPTNVDVQTLSDSSRESIAAFRSRLQELTLTTADPDSTIDFDSDVVPNETQRPTNDGKRGFPKQRLIVAAVVVAAVGVAAVVFTTRHYASIVTDDQRDLPRKSVLHVATTTEKGPSTDSSSEGDSALESDLQTLQTFDDVVSDGITDELSGEDLLDLDLLRTDVLSFAPTLNSTAIESSAETGGPIDKTASTDSQGATESATDSAPSTGRPTAPSADLMADDATNDDPEESPQPTRATTASVALPDMSDSDAKELWPTAIDSLAISFPFEVAIDLKSGGSANVWTVQDTRKQEPIATIQSQQEGTIFRWDADAKSVSVAPSLLHARLTAGNAAVYLRPTIETDPWKIQFDKSDVRPSWKLGGPIPPRASRLEIEIDLPEKTNVQWVESLDAAKLRNARALAILRPDGAETVAIGIRLDIRCTSKFMCRVRFAGRLDPTQPWQWVSSGALEQFAEQLTNQATAISNEITRLAALYERAGRSDRRILKPRRDRLAKLAEQTRIMSERVAQLRTMIDSLEANGSLRPRIWVQWPESEQALLTTVSQPTQPGRGDGDDL